MKKTFFVVICCMFLFTACSLDITKDDVDKAKEVFSEQLDNLYEMYENGGKEVLENISVENAEKMLNDALEKIPEDKKELVYKGIEKGVSIIEDGKEIIANELEMNVSLEGMKEEIEAFLESLSNIDARISVDNVVVEKDENTYKLDCTINFFYENKN